MIAAPTFLVGMGIPTSNELLLHSLLVALRATIQQ